LPARKWAPQHLDDFGDALRASGRVASRPAQPHQETYVTRDAIADSAETRLEKSFLENREQGIVKIGCLGNPPQFFSDLGCFRGEAKEVREEAGNPVQ